LWGFPGGHVGLGETAIEAAARELREETGVIARPLRYLTNVDVIVRNDEDEIAFHFLLAAVLCEYVSGQPAAADDASEAGWWGIAGIVAGELQCSEHVDEVVKLAIR
jgi:ADP-ribose pyrophosphatase YjhB (NUDIX family)